MIAIIKSFFAIMCNARVHKMRLKREAYLEQKRPYYDSDIVKVITGIRRSGKSNYLERTKKAYLLPTEETIQKEFGTYRKITDASPKYVMSLNKVDMSHDGIVHMNIVDFLLRKTDLILT